MSISGPHANDFSVSVQPGSPVGMGETTIFKVRFDPSAEGLREAVVSIANDDSDENPYDFAIQGTGTVLDTDGDGLSDIQEQSSCTDYLDADTDNDGIIDGDEDINHDGIVDPDETNPCLSDSDGDGIQDGTEMGYPLADIGPDTDTGVFIPDADPSTTTDPTDPDSDDDGFKDGEEDLNFNGMVDPGETNPNEVPTLVKLGHLAAVHQGNQVSITWITLSETNTVGFNLLRSELKDGKYSRINSKIIEAEGGATLNAEYSYTDDTAKPGVIYYYRLEDIDNRGISTFHGPVSVTISMAKTVADYYPPYWPDVYGMGMNSKYAWSPVYGPGYSWWPYYPYL